jgi:hypothetical protein
MSIKHFYPVAVAAFLGCATVNTSGGLGEPGVPRRGNMLTAAQMADAHADVTTAYDAVARLRPNWLAAHGVASNTANGPGTEYALVFVDGQLYGGLDALRNIPAYHVGAFRYYDVTEAGARFGIKGGSSGVIEVTMRAPGR